MPETFLEEDDLSGFFKARVIKNVDQSGDGQIGVFIPDLMPNVTESDSETEATESIKPTSDIFEGSEEFASEVNNKVKSSNFIWCRPAGNLVETHTKSTSDKNVSGNYRIPEIGTWITVFFDNQDPNRPYYLPFSMTNFGEVIAGMLLGKTNLSAETEQNWLAPEARILIDVITEYSNKNVIYVDNNENANSFVIQWANGHEIVVHHAEESGIRLKTEQGHGIHLDENSTEMRLKTHIGNVNVIYRDKDGSMDIKNTGDYTQKTEGKLTINITGNATIKTDADALVDAKGNATIKSGGDATVDAAGTATIKAGGAVTVSGSPVNLN